MRIEAAPPATKYGAAPAPLPLVPEPAPLPAPVNNIIEIRSEPESLYTVPRTAASQRVAVVAAGPPIAITRSVYNAPGIQPGVDDWNYAFETENTDKYLPCNNFETANNNVGLSEARSHFPRFYSSFLPSLEGPSGKQCK